jgi:hypothetical protein
MFKNIKKKREVVGGKNHNLHFSPFIIRVNKSKKIWEGYAARRGKSELRLFLFVNLKDRRPFKNQTRGLEKIIKI